MRIETVVIQGRFRGPPHSANGGYSCGVLARHLDGTVGVRLSAPPPLDAELRLESDADEARLFHGEIPLGVAKRSALSLDAPNAPSFEQAQDAATRYVGFSGHPFPTCFVCGPERASGDGLRIFCGAVAGRDMVASPWIPAADLTNGSGAIAREYIWSSLDCSGAFAVLPEDPSRTTIVLGELVASITGQAHAGQRHVVAGWRIGMDGRKRYAGSALYDEKGNAIAVARATWIEVPTASFTVR